MMNYYVFGRFVGPRPAPQPPADLEARQARGLLVTAIVALLCSSATLSCAFAGLAYAPPAHRAHA